MEKLTGMEKGNWEKKKLNDTLNKLTLKHQLEQNANKRTLKLIHWNCIYLSVSELCELKYIMTKCSHTQTHRHQSILNKYRINLNLIKWKRWINMEKKYVYSTLTRTRNDLFFFGKKCNCIECV